MSKLSSWKAIFLLYVFCAVTAISSPAQSFTTLVNCDQTNCFAPGVLVQGTDGDLYGTSLGGIYGGGNAFKLTTAGELTTLYSFCGDLNCIAGDGPSGLLLATNGNFYGTTSAGGANTWGTAFKITPGGTVTTLYNFCFQDQGNCADGGEPSLSFQAAGILLAVTRASLRPSSGQALRRVVNCRRELHRDYVCSPRGRRGHKLHS